MLAKSKGYYRLEITTPTAPATLCIAVTVTPGGGSPKTLAGAQGTVQADRQYTVRQRASGHNRSVAFQANH